MKLKNIKVGQKLKLKTVEEIKSSKYFDRHESCNDLYFTDGTMYYSGDLDASYGGSLVEVYEIDGDNIRYTKPNGRHGHVSRHAFKKSKSNNKTMKVSSMIINNESIEERCSFWHDLRFKQLNDGFDEYGLKIMYGYCKGVVSNKDEIFCRLFDGGTYLAIVVFVGDIFVQRQSDKEFRAFDELDIRGISEFVKGGIE